MAVLDTDIMVSLLRGEPKAVERIRSLEQSGEQICTTIVSEYELLKGARISSKAEENLERIRGMLSSLRVLGLTSTACEDASRSYEELRRKRKMNGEFDILIGSIVKFHDEKLLTRDEDFKSISGLNLVRW